jgi:hypothetical protein
MKSFKQYINEIFDNPYKYYWAEDGPYREFSLAYFYTDKPEESLYSVGITEKYIDNVEVGFMAYPDYKENMKNYDLDVNDANDILNYIGKYGTDQKLDLNTKDVPRIFATVIKVAEEYYDRFKPKIIFFNAKNSESNRVRLYSRIAKRFAQKYDLELSTDPGDYSTSFILTNRRRMLKLK